jgi:hypothetical protein
MIDKELISKSLPTSWMASARFKGHLEGEGCGGAL